jgi:hypothetical protein
MCGLSKFDDILGTSKLHFTVVVMRVVVMDAKMTEIRPELTLLRS